MGLKRKWSRSRVALAGVAGTAALVLAGCGSTPETALGLPESASDSAVHIADLWVGSWIAAFAIGILMWGLMFWAVIRYRRRHSDEVPRQTRYHLPLELLYTLVPILIVGVLFYFTVLTQNKVQAQDPNPDQEIEVIGQKWSWTFNYGSEKLIGEDVWDAGTIERVPTLVVPVNERIRFTLESPDVIHSFWIPAFHYKLDIIPGRTNSFDVTPTKEGTFVGRCAELCGTYHSAMIFNVKVVSADEYEAHLEDLKERGQTGAIELTDYTKKSTLPPAAEQHSEEGNR